MGRKLTLVAGPSDEGKAIGAEKKQLAGRHLLRLKFSEQLLALATQNGVTWHAGQSPVKEHWLGGPSGKAGLAFTYVIGKDDARVELYISTADTDENKKIFDQFLARKNDLEATFGAPFEWERLDGRRACRIGYTITLGGLRDEAQWPQIQVALVDAMRRLLQTLKPLVDGLKR